MATNSVSNVHSAISNSDTFLSVGKSYSDCTTTASKISYCITRPFAVFFFYPLSSPILLGLHNSVTGSVEKIDQCREFLSDIGGVSVSIDGLDGSILDGMYFDPAEFNKRKDSAFDKWSRLFSQPEYKGIADWFEIDSNGQDLASLMRLPQIASIDNKNILGLVVCGGAGNLFESNPQDALSYLLRGKSVLVFNYRGVLKSKGIPDGKTTCLDAKNALVWLKQQLHCKNSQLCIHGKSMGTGPALWTGTQIRGVNVIIDRPFTEMNSAVDHAIDKSIVNDCVRLRSFLNRAITEFYPYPNKALISLVTGRVCIMQAQHDAVIAPHSGEELFEKRKNFPVSYTRLIHASGGHSSKVSGDPEYSWFCDQGTHDQLTEFLRDK